MPILRTKGEDPAGPPVPPTTQITIPPPPDPDPFRDPISTALVDLIFERGYEAVTERAIVDRAGTTLGEFHHRFVDKLDCTIKTIEAAAQDFGWMVETAYGSGSDWREGLRASAWAIADHIDRHPTFIHVLVIGLMQTKSEMLRVLREESLMYGAQVIERGRAEAPDPSAVPAAAGMVAMGSIAQLLTHRLQKGADLELRETVPQMLYLSVRPYLGEEAAREELHAPRPPGSFVR
ncbi:MAG TPA: TetR/AcrR family transcriptional regulator [Solirubrobacterales bacterium]|nr:TetR/AcrR family transcriptional regulator [Solirubrobacterales bacterium]